MIFRQIKLFIYKAKMYVKKHHVRKSFLSDWVPRKDVAEIAHRARELYKVSVLLRRYRRTNAFKILMEED